MSCSILISGNFELTVEQGQFSVSEIIVMMGENGTGKTTFIRMLAGRLTPDNGGNILLIEHQTKIK